MRYVRYMYIACCLDCACVCVCRVVVTLSPGLVTAKEVCFGGIVGREAVLCVCVHVYACVRVCVCVCVCVCACVHMYVRACMHVCVCMRACVHACVCVCSDLRQPDALSQILGHVLQHH